MAQTPYTQDTKSENVSGQFHGYAYAKYIRHEVHGNQLKSFTEHDWSVTNDHPIRKMKVYWETHHKVRIGDNEIANASHHQWSPQFSPGETEQYPTPNVDVVATFNNQSATFRVSVYTSAKVYRIEGGQTRFVKEIKTKEIERHFTIP